MTCVAEITGKTPGKGGVITRSSKEFIECCAKCDGVFPSVKFNAWRAVFVVGEPRTFVGNSGNICAVSHLKLK